MRSTVARRAYCVSLDYRLFKFQLKYVILLELFFNYGQFQRFHRHLKNARSNLASGPFLDLVLSHLPLIESVCRSKPDHF